MHVYCLVSTEEAHSLFYKQQSPQSSSQTKMLKLLFLLILLFENQTHAINNETLGLSELLFNIMKLSNTELVYISDFDNENKVDLLNIISVQGIPIQVFNLKGLKSLQNSRPFEPCPYFVEPYEENKQEKHSVENRIVIPSDQNYLRFAIV